MSLIKCKECTKEISDQADCCQNCGAPTQQSSLFSKEIGFGGFIYAVLIGIGLILVLTGSSYGYLILVIGAVLLYARLKTWSGVRRK